jgi:hypothetical protein
MKPGIAMEPGSSIKNRSPIVSIAHKISMRQGLIRLESQSMSPSSLFREVNDFEKLRAMGNLVKIQKDLRSLTIATLREVIS